MSDIKTDSLSKENNDFWSAMEDVRDGMLALEGEFMVPMSPKVRDDKFDGRIWFVTADGTDLYEGVKNGGKDARFVVSAQSAGLWADVKGMLTVTTDKDVLDDVWSAMTGVWFEDGKRDDDVRLLCFTPREAEATISDDSALEFFYKMAKAKITGDTPDGMGWQGKLNFTTPPGML